MLSVDLLMILLKLVLLCLQYKGSYFPYLSPSLLSDSCPNNKGKLVGMRSI